LKISAPSPAIKKSTFVTVVAVIFILLSSTAIVMSVFHWVTAPESFLDVFKQPQDDLPLTFLTTLMLLTFALSILTLVSSAGLLARKQWSRIAFITSMSINIFLKIALMVTVTKIFYFMSEVTQTTEIKKYPLIELIELLFNLLEAFIAIVYIGIVTYSMISILISIWLINRFMSEKIKQAFHTPNQV
jgi:hypothetical protein